MASSLPPRVNFIGAPEFYNLNAACLLVTEAFHGLSCGTFHVGSSITRRDYRDVDVRVIMPDEDFERMFAAKRGGWSNALWSLMCVSISAWLKERTGLPIDFQIQSMSEANGDHPNGHRNSLGLFVPRHQKVTEREGLHVGDPVLLTDSNRGGLTGVIVGFTSGSSYADVRLADGTHTAVERVALRVLPQVSGTTSERKGT